MKILLTGGAGYIGSHASLALLDAGYKITIIDDLSTGNKKLIPSNASFVECNINDTATVAELIQKEKFDALMHFAGFVQVEESIRNPKKYFDNNTENAKILFDTCVQHNLKNIIFSSTAAVYGNPTDGASITETAMLKPINPYGKSKIQTEEYLQNNKTINHVILRYFNVAGADPSMRCGLISEDPTHLIKIASETAVGKREKVIIFGNDYPTTDGTAIRDYIHVSDLADIHVKAAEHLVTNQQSAILNCGYGRGFSVKNVLEIANAVNNKPLPTEMGSRREGDAAMLVSNVSKLHQLLDWKPKHNDLFFIIKTAIEWERKLMENENT
jgi:UDP-glucose 4-epimerase